MQTLRLFRGSNKKGVIFTALLLAFSITPTFAQLFNVGGPQPSFGGARVYVSPGAQMYIGGDLKIWDDTLINQGHIIVDGRFFNDDQCGGDGNPLPGNNGLFEIKGDRWVNNGTFHSGTGKVLFNGTDQFQDIAGDSITRFYDLEIDSGQIKRLEMIDAVVKNNLELNNKEFATENEMLFVTNTNHTAITRADSGFVSSLVGGALSWDVEGTNNYVFPVGSSLFTGYKYRPAVITPNDNSPRTYTVRYVNSNPSPAPPNGPGFDVTLHDDSICFINPDYWYEIKNTSNNQSALADLSLTYDAQTEGGFNGIARWDLLGSPQRWNSLNSEFTVTNFITTPTNYILVTRKAWFNYDPNNSAYNLSFRYPYPPEITGAVELCADDDTLYSVTASTPYNTTFTWQVTNGVISDSSSNTEVDIIWNDVDSGYITVIETVDNLNSFNGSCPSFPGQLAVDIWPLPEAIFDVDYQYNNGLSVNPDGLLFTNELVSYLDESTNTQDWYWDFGDGSTSIMEDPFHTYSDVGDYTVMLVTTSPDGCLDTTYKDLTVSEGLIIPNVFTPNGDGMNDEFILRNSNISEFKLEVYNRWGNLIYTTVSPEVSWDGRTTAGIEAPAGTYFWTVSASLESGGEFTTNASDHPFKETGTVTLIR